MVGFFSLRSFLFKGHKDLVRDRVSQSSLVTVTENRCLRMDLKQLNGVQLDLQLL